MAAIVGGALIALLAGACGGDDAGAEATQSADGVVTLDLSGGAAPEGIDITITPAEAPTDLPEGVTVLAAYDFGPSGVAFAEPATATISLDEVSGAVIPVMVSDGVAEVPRTVEVWLGDSPQIAFSVDHFSTAFVVQLDGEEGLRDGVLTLIPGRIAAIVGDSFRAKASWYGGPFVEWYWSWAGAVSLSQTLTLPDDESAEFQIADFLCSAVGPGTYTYSGLFLQSPDPARPWLPLALPYSQERSYSYTLHGQAECLQNAEGTGSTLSVSAGQIPGYQPEEIDIWDEPGPPTNPRVANAIEFIEGLLTNCDDDPAGDPGIAEAIEYVEGLLIEDGGPEVDAAMEFVAGLLGNQGFDQPAIDENSAYFIDLLEGGEGPDPNITLDCGDPFVVVGTRDIAYESVTETCQVQSPTGGAETVTLDPTDTTPMAAVVEFTSDEAGLRIVNADPGALWVDLTDVTLADGTVTGTGSFAGAAVMDGAFNGEVAESGEMRGILTISLASPLSECVITANLTIGAPNG